MRQATIADAPVCAIIVNGEVDHYVESYVTAQREAAQLRAQGYQAKVRRFESWMDAYAWEDRRAMH